MNDETILHARFHPRLPLYLVMAPALVMTLTVVGIPLLLVWIPVGMLWARTFVDRLTCRLTEDTLEIGKGVLFRKELTIPLDRIQEISLREGPLQRYLGISSLRFETAGGGSPTDASDLDLPGILRARDFRSRVLSQRDRRRASRSGSEEPRGEVPDDGVETSLSVLREIRDSIRRIEERGIETRV